MPSSPSARRALLLGGTGAIGGATAERLARDGWAVDVTGRDPLGMPAELTALGVRFHAVDRADARGIERLVGDGVDLLVDLVAFTAADVQALLPSMRASGSVVVASSRAVLVDAAGRHVNGDEPPRFPVPIPESTPTLAPAAPGADPFSREGYAPSKVAVERAALASGLPVTVIRPSKVHGRWARNARTRGIVERMLAGAETVEARRPRRLRRPPHGRREHGRAHRPGRRRAGRADPPLRRPGSAHGRRDRAGRRRRGSAGAA
ncbi:NAD-dependent epimerase/dehydratase family protein [Clavibacter tessellarius]|uniref:NAD-dependent epimerase/dehydratase family protein n=1 Tax=Clavibacter tessellarius TaxID=31965 RepID=UPI00324AF56A